MRRPAPQNEFLDRPAYRQRRLRDALRMMPLAGWLLWMVPLLWRAGPDTALQTSAAVQYVFGIWVGLIAVSILLAGRMRHGDDAGGRSGL